MTPFRNRLSPLTKRMAEDMLVRNLSPSTIDSYTYHVDKFLEYFGQPAEELGPAEIREYWKQRRPPTYLFTGKDEATPLSSTTIQKACKAAALEAKLSPAISPHTLRHSFATGLLEAGVDLLTIGQLLGHRSFDSTLVYLHVRRPHLQSTPSPLDWLPVRQCPSWRGLTQPPHNDPTQQDPQ